MSSRLGTSIALALVGAAAFAGVLDATKIAWTPKSGAAYKFRFKSVVHGIQAPTGTADLTVLANMTDTIKEIKSDGNIVVEEKQSDLHVTLGEQDMSSMVPQSITETLTEKPNGEVIERKTDNDQGGSERINAVSQFSYPDHDVNVGDTWTHALKADSAKKTYDSTTTYTYQGEDTVDGVKCYKVSASFKESGAPTNMTAAGTVWLSEEDGYMVKVKMAVKNADLPGGLPPADSDIDIDRVSA